MTIKPPCLTSFLPGAYISKAVCATGGSFSSLVSVLAGDGGETGDGDVDVAGAEADSVGEELEGAGAEDEDDAGAGEGVEGAGAEDEVSSSGTEGVSEEEGSGGASPCWIFVESKAILRLLMSVSTICQKYLASWPKMPTASENNS